MWCSVVLLMGGNVSVKADVSFQCRRSNRLPRWFVASIEPRNANHGRLSAVYILKHVTTDQLSNLLFFEDVSECVRASIHAKLSWRVILNALGKHWWYAKSRRRAHIAKHVIDQCHTNLNCEVFCKDSVFKTAVAPANYSDSSSVRLQFCVAVPMCQLWSLTLPDPEWCSSRSV
jgi:hypothetical protein